MIPSTLLLIAATIVLDVFGQLGFKLGLNGIGDSHADARRPAFWLRLFTQRWLLLGIAAYACEFFLWLAVLSRVQLSIAFPLASLSYCGVLIVSRAVLGEAISRRRWAGCGLITLGAALVCTGIQ
ncbi:MAG: EamA-like transporter [Hydrocarboniphaga sp.]|uniref:EamA family transporter n=1 Tax=Hydrocarboniphaga sp. TaxID=2033016 RepID=UPI00260E9A6A|nr:EamA family transporter [Hydrocarboniphaga sp.]MDB5972571.1 EamA-like transporter [Hydrocarboniphaga sp.]